MFRIINHEAETIFESDSVSDVERAIRNTSFGFRLFNVFVVEENMTYDALAWIKKFAPSA